MSALSKRETFNVGNVVTFETEEIDKYGIAQVKTLTGVVCGLSEDVLSQYTDTKFSFGH